MLPLVFSPCRTVLSPIAGPWGAESCGKITSFQHGIVCLLCVASTTFIGYPYGRNHLARYYTGVGHIFIAFRAWGGAGKRLGGRGLGWRDTLPNANDCSHYRLYHASYYQYVANF